MQLASFEAALELIERGPADQPLMRILKAALEIADCPVGLIGVRTEVCFRIFVSTGLPLSNFTLELERTEDIAEALREARIFEDIREEPAFANHPYVIRPPYWRFVASVPLPAAMLPYPVLLMCCDPRVNQPRRPGLLRSLSACAAIAADALSLIGDVAVQANMITEVRDTRKLRDESVENASVPMALVDQDGAVVVSSQPFRQLLGRDDAPSAPLRLADFFPIEAGAISARLQAVLSGETPSAAQPAHIAGAPDCLCTIDMIRVVTADSTQPMALCTIADQRRMLSSAAQLARPAGESPAVVSDFLSATLIRQTRLLRRGDVPYHALRRWRASVKDVQLAALKALKADPPAAFVDAVAEELAAAARSLFGKETVQAVVAVPCGNSGPECLARRLAAAVAARLDLVHIEAFEPLAPSGGSHPQGNVRREKMRLATPVTKPVLLIDDVATSGAHLAEAALLLKSAGAAAVLPMAWVAAG